jgi:hypothetical protein
MIYIFSLFMPVLPVFENLKVIYGLCSRCMSEQNRDEFCTHTDKERIIEGTFVSGTYYYILTFHTHRIFQLSC